MAAVTPDTEQFDPIALQRLLDGTYAEAREQIREVLCRPEFSRCSGCRPTGTASGCCGGPGRWPAAVEP